MFAWRRNIDGKVRMGPPPARNRKRYPFVGTIDFQGFQIRVESPRGAKRSGVDADGRQWSVTMPAHYGEFAATEGSDGDAVDVFVGDDAHAPFAYVIHIRNPETEEYDEDKVFLGFKTAEDARACFDAAYNRTDIKMGPVRKMSVGELRAWLGRKGSKIVGGDELSRSLEIPRFLAYALDAVLVKGAGHKYLRRVATGNLKRPWKYYYTVAGGRGLGHHEEFEKGSAFRVKDGGKDGHFHVTEVLADGKLRIRHDESGHEATLDPAALSAMLKREHAEKLESHTERVKRDLVDVSKHGTEKQRAKLRELAERYEHTRGLVEKKADPTATMSHWDARQHHLERSKHTTGAAKAAHEEAAHAHRLAYEVGGYHKGVAREASLRAAKAEQAEKPEAAASRFISEARLVNETESDTPEQKQLERGAGGRTVAAQVEKDARDWGEKIGGARKDKWDEVTTRNIQEIEETDPAQAHRLVTKERVLGKHDPDRDRTLGLSAGASLIKREVFRAVAPRPENSRGHRAAYVNASDWLVKALDRSPTVEAMENFLREWQRTVRERRVKGAVVPFDAFVTAVGAVPATPEISQRLYGEGSYPREIWGPDGTRYIYGMRDAEKAGFVAAEQRIRDLTPAEAGQFEAIKTKMRGGGMDTFQAYNSFREGLKHGGAVQTYVHTPDVERLTQFAHALGQGFEKQLLNKTTGRESSALWQRVKEAGPVEQSGDWSVLAPKTGANRGESSIPRSEHGWKRGVEKAERVGPLVKTVTSEAALAEDFGLRRGEFGRSVEQPIGDAHVSKAYEAFSDLAEVLGLDKRQISNGGQLAVAFGARGSGGAQAHYESDKRVINITKLAAGSLAHEWGHFLDHILSRDELVSAGANRLRTTFSSHAEHDRALPHDVKSAFDDVMGVIRWGREHGSESAIQAAGQELKEATAAARGSRWGSPEQRRAQEAANKLRGAMREHHPTKPSKYAADASKLGDYWARPHEMFARAFEAYVEDTIAAKKRKSEYLVNGTVPPRMLRRVVKGKLSDEVLEPYPQGDERAAINEAMERLFGVLPKSGRLQKAMMGAPAFAWGFLAKSAAPKYTHREPTGNAAHPWRYFYGHEGDGRPDGAVDTRALHRSAVEAFVALEAARRRSGDRRLIKKLERRFVFAAKAFQRATRAYLKFKNFGEGVSRR